MPSFNTVSCVKRTEMVAFTKDTAAALGMFVTILSMIVLDMVVTRVGKCSWTKLDQIEVPILHSLWVRVSVRSKSH